MHIPSIPVRVSNHNKKKNENFFPPASHLFEYREEQQEFLWTLVLPHLSHPYIQNNYICMSKACGPNRLGVSEQGESNQQQQIQ